MENEEKVAKRIKDKKTKIQRAQEVHKRKSKERAENFAHLKAAYQANKDGLVIKDILEKARKFANYHTKLAQDGVGFRNTGAKLTDGSAEQEIYYFTNEKRVSELDKSAGLLELVDYIERQLKVDLPEPVEEPEEPEESTDDSE